jgi:L-glutamine-phosphate cytidylyltransferase
MKALIIAAGYGTRLGNLTKKMPKSLIDINGKSILKRQIELLQSNGVTEIIIITGPNHEKFLGKKIKYVKDNFYENHEQLGSLMEGRNYFNDELLILFSDVLFDNQVISKIINSENNFNIAVDSDWRKKYIGRTEHPISQADLVLIKNNLVFKIMKNLTPVNNFKISEFIGIIKLSKKASKKFLKHYTNLEKSKNKIEIIKKWYLTNMLQDLIDNNNSITPIEINGNWCEIDTVQDLERARKLFS